MAKTLLIIAVACVLGYLLRRNFRRAWYVLRTGDEHPDFETLGADYFIAPWEKRRMDRSPERHEANDGSVSE